VWRAVNRKDRSVVAVKKIFDAFQNATDAQVRLCACRGAPGEVAPSDAYPAQRTFREIMFLQELDNHDNIIR